MNEYEKLNEKAIKSWVISRIFGTVILTIILIVIRIFLFKIIDNYAEINLIITTIMIIIILISLLTSFINPIFEYKQWKYKITEDKIEFTEGIYFVRRVIIPIVRIQHIQLNQGPINKFLKLYDITIFTAGGQHKIPNIQAERAEEISEYLKNTVKLKIDNEEDSTENIVLENELENH
ncbi:PH domain-containing protein [Clostridium tertium]|uniref:Bacterial membrane flanked domain protein n=1 Tax=Clostridium tertium TaxID=1559 RepID=A0A6N2YEX4_9CLOT